MSCRILCVSLILCPVVASAAKPVCTQTTRSAEPSLFPFRAEAPEGKWGYINSDGAVAIKPVYAAAGDFVDGRARVTLSEKTGYINEDGAWVFTLPEGWAVTRPFAEGLAGYSVGNMYSGKWGFLDRDGNIVVPPKYQQVGEFADGLARVNVGAKWQFPGIWEGGKWGYIDKTGRVVIPIEFEYAYDFSGNHASVKKAGDWLHIDRQGRQVTIVDNRKESSKPQDLPVESVRSSDGQLRQTNDREPFRGPLARVHIGGTFCVADDGPAEWSGGAWYYVNRQGTIVRQVRTDEQGQLCGYGKENR